LPPGSPRRPTSASLTRASCFKTPASGRSATMGEMRKGASLASFRSIEIEYIACQRDTPCQAHRPRAFGRACCGSVVALRCPRYSWPAWGCISFIHWSIHAPLVTRALPTAGAAVAGPVRAIARRYSGRHSARRPGARLTTWLVLVRVTRTNASSVPSWRRSTWRLRRLPRTLAGAIQPGIPRPDLLSLSPAVTQHPLSAPGPLPRLKSPDRPSQITAVLPQAIS
jgi:hypothetical protein